MAVQPKKYISKGGRIIRGIKITEKNYLDAFNWATRNAKNIVWRDESNGGPKDRNMASVHIQNGDESNHRFYLHLRGKGVRVARVGDVVAFEVGADGKIVDFRAFIVKQHIFLQKEYALVPRGK